MRSFKLIRLALYLVFLWVTLCIGNIFIRSEWLNRETYLRNEDLLRIWMILFLLRDFDMLIYIYIIVIKTIFRLCSYISWIHRKTWCSIYGLPYSLRLLELSSICVYMTYKPTLAGGNLCVLIYVYSCHFNT